jgi:hypothetical protein
MVDCSTWNNLGESRETKIRRAAHCASNIALRRLGRWSPNQFGEALHVLLNVIAPLMKSGEWDRPKGDGGIL